MKKWYDWVCAVLIIAAIVIVVRSFILPIPDVSYQSVPEYTTAVMHKFMFYGLGLALGLATLVIWSKFWTQKVNDITK